MPDEKDDQEFMQALATQVNVLAEQVETLFGPKPTTEQYLQFLFNQVAAQQIAIDQLTNIADANTTALANARKSREEERA